MLSCLSSCVSMLRFSHIEMDCPKNPTERTNALVQLCRQNMDTVVLDVTPTLTKIQAVKYHWRNPVDSVRFYVDFVWTLYLRNDSLMGYAERRVGAQDDWNPKPYFDDTVADTPETQWYWGIRRGIEQICGMQVMFLNNTQRFVAWNQDLKQYMDSSLFPISPFAEVLTPASPAEIQARSTFNAATSRQVFFDDSLALREIDGTLAQAIRLFPTSQHYDRVRLFQNMDSSYTLETRKHGMDATLRHFQVPDTMLRAFQTYFRGLNDRNMFRREFLADEVYIHPSSRGYIGTSTFTLSCLQGLYGFVFPFAPLFPSNSLLVERTLNPISAISGLVGGAILAQYSGDSWYTHLSDIALNDGITWGIPQGILLAGLVMGEQANLGVMHLAGMGFGMLRGALSMRLPETLGLNLAQTEMIQGAGVTGLTIGFAAPLAAGTFRPLEPEAASFQGAAAFSFFGSLAGYGVGYLFATDSEHPVYAGNGMILDIPSKVGLAVPLSFMLTQALMGIPLTSAQIQEYAGWTIAGQALGYGLGIACLQGNHFTYQQGLTVLAGGTAGAMPGAILMYIAARLGQQGRELLGISSIVGSVGFGAGFLIALGTQIKDARQNYFLREKDRTASLQSSHSSLFDTPFFQTLPERLHASFSPMGLAALAAPNLLPAGLSLPILSVQYRFLDEPMKPESVEK